MTPLKRIFAFVTLLLMVTAFVAPIPISNAVSTCDTAMTISERIKSPKPNLGPFTAEETFEHDGVRMKLIVSGNAEEREGNIYADFQQTLITLDDDDNEISRQIEYRTMETCIAPETTESPEKPKQSFTPATDWGTFTTYTWVDLFSFVSAPGSSKQKVIYDHPNNYYLYYPEQWNLDWAHSLSHWAGGSYTIIHASQYVVTQVESSNSLWSWVFATAVMLIGVYGAITIAALPFALQLLAVTLAFLAVYAGLIWLWTLYVWKAEQGDAWSYTYLGTNGWLQMSHGLWRDIWYYAYYVG